jgi:putative alpha-1,2-mannosidase
MMGSLSVLMKTGLFQMTGGTEENPAYQIGSPLFDKITIHLNNHYYPGGTFVIQTQNNSAANSCVSKADFNGVPVNDANIRHNDIVKGGTLTLRMEELVKYE